MSTKAVKDHFWDRHYRVIDLVASIIAGTLMWCITRNRIAILTSILYGDRSTLYATFASIFGALLGFVVTSFSIVVGFLSSESMSRVRGTTAGAQIPGVFIWGSIWVGLATVFPLVGLIFDRDGVTHTDAKPWLCGIITGTCVAGGLALYRCLRILSLSARVIMAAKDSTAGK